jgi:hypothetical protein
VRDDERITSRQRLLEVFQAMVGYFRAVPCEKVVKSAGKTAGLVASAPVAIVAGGAASEILTPVGGVVVAAAVLGTGATMGEKAGNALAATVCPAARGKLGPPMM